MIYKCLYVVVLLIPLSVFGQLEINHWETVVFENQQWKYYPALSEPPSDWMNPEFNDSVWQIGPGGIGYGDEDDQTPIEQVYALYLRTDFQIIDTSKILYGLLHADYDDAFIAYLNGVEIARSNIGIVGDRPAFDELPNHDHEATIYQNSLPEYFEIDKESLTLNLRQGTNILAIQVQNDGINSSDLTGRFWLSLGISNNSQQYMPVPDWFQPPVFLTTSNLPIVQINTSNQPIIDDPRIIAEMNIINNDGANHIQDVPNEYDGRISIELRGSSSQSRFLKKSYGLETQLSNGDNNNVSLLGMPTENDWILYGPFSDKTLLRNDIVYRASRKMGQYATRIELCELVINQKYQGVYAFMEKIKRDNNRVDIAKLNPNENEGEDLTGGYILKIDKRTGSGGEGWFSNIQPANYEDRELFFQYEYPDEAVISQEQKAYIQQYIDDFESTLFGADFKDPINGYRKYIDTKSFIDFFLANELAYNVDGYRLSVFMHKKNDRNGGKLHMGPIWDFNLSIGNGWDCQVQNREDYMYNYNEKCPNATTQIPFWWSRLLEDEAFANEVKCAWQTYRNDFLKTDSLLNYIDQQANFLEDAQKRNFIRWPILGHKVHFNFFLADDYEGEVEYIKDWLNFRLEWLDNNLFGYCGNLELKNETSLQSILYPNPANEEITLDIYIPERSRVNIVINDAIGREIMKPINDEIYDVGFKTIQIPVEPLSSGVYMITIFAVNNRQTLKLIKY